MEFEAIIPDIRIRKCAVVRSLDWLCWLSLARCRVLIQLEIWNLESVSRVGANSDRVMWGGGVIRLLAQAPPHQTNWGPTCWSLYCTLRCTVTQYSGQSSVSSDTDLWTGHLGTQATGWLSETETQAVLRVLSVIFWDAVRWSDIRVIVIREMFAPRWPGGDWWHLRQPVARAARPGLGRPGRSWGLSRVSPVTGTQSLPRTWSWHKTRLVSFIPVLVSLCCDALDPGLDILVVLPVSSCLREIGRELSGDRWGRDAGSGSFRDTPHSSHLDSVRAKMCKLANFSTNATHIFCRTKITVNKWIFTKLSFHNKTSYLIFVHLYIYEISTNDSKFCISHVPKAVQPAGCCFVAELIVRATLIHRGFNTILEASQSCERVRGGYHLEYDLVRKWT